MTNTKRIEITIQGQKTELWIQDLKDFDWQKEDILKWVSSERIKKAERLKSEAAKKSAIGAEYLFNKVLAQKKREGKLPNEMKECVFPLSYARNEWGAPYFSGNPLYFNWSHSESYVVLAISDNPVGIDIQKRKKYRLSVAEKYFPKEICKKLKSLEGIEQEKLFFRCWTLLEAWLKARGTGFYQFSIPDIAGAFSEETGLKEGGTIAESPIKVKEAEEKQIWEYQFWEEIAGYELCLVQKFQKKVSNRRKIVKKS